MSTFAGDPIERLEHKYLRRFQELSERIDIWKQIGPACSEEEWNAAEAALEHANEVVRLITANDDYKVPTYRLKNANHHWKLYNHKKKLLRK